MTNRLLVADGLEVVAVWIADIRAEVVGVIGLSHSRRVVLGRACRQSGGVERVNDIGAVGREGDVEPALHGAALRFRPERGVPVLAKAGGWPGSR